MIIESDIKLDFKDVLIKPKKSTLKSRSEVNLNIHYKSKHSKKQLNDIIPIMVSNMDTTGTFTLAKAAMKHNIITCIHKHYTLSQWIDFINSDDLQDNWYNYIAISAGINDINKLYTILDMFSDIQFICLDIANGYINVFSELVKEVRTKYPDKIIIAGNVVTADMTQELILSGADIVKVGIGPGSVCTTRIKTGVGYPQLSSIIECATAAHELDAHIISDGGCTCPGDFSKAFGAGADFVMSGGIFSGHTECEGELVIIDNIKYHKFYGMSSSNAMIKYNGKMDAYRSSEGKEVLVKFKGRVEHTIMDILGGIRSTCAYLGTYNLQKISKYTTFIRVTQQSNQVFNTKM